MCCCPKCRGNDRNGFSAKVRANLVRFRPKSRVPQADNPAHMLSMAAFTMLPTELHGLIIGYLEFPSITQLKRTNHYFNTLVKATDIYEAENSDYAKLHGLWACKECASLRPSSQFSDKNKKGKRGKPGSEATKRFCIPCGLKLRPHGGSLYGPGDRIVIGGKLHLICKTCRQITRRSNDTRENLCEYCDREERMLKTPLTATVVTTRSSRAIDSFNRYNDEPYHCDIQERIRAARLEATALKEKILRKKAELEAPAAFKKASQALVAGFTTAYDD